MNALEQLSKVNGSVSIQDGIATLEDGTTINLATALAQQNEVVAALRDNLGAFQSGDCYETVNPYRRPCVERGLKALKDFENFPGDWKDASPLKS